MIKQRRIMVTTQRPPVVELDSEAQAAYIRFTHHKVARTQPVLTEGCIVTVDFDAKDEVIGIELVGVTEFGVGPLLKKAGMTARPKRVLEKVRYVPAKLAA
jgi:uncharacterized protein YuzE